ncbi:MAG: NAD(P)/FAD-dependent oxidoreductase [Bacillota bacterium]|nr:NAD(P)/FAD-dependent oxidoreductase [Bacillota bacterium]
MRVIIVGSGAAAASAHDAILSSEVRATVTLISRESDEPYSKVALPKYISGQVDRAKAFLARPAATRPDTGDARPEFTQLLGTTVVSIDRAARTVLATGPTGRAEVPYEALILAVGATPSHRFGQPVWTLDDADRVKALVTEGKTAAVTGGGFLGLHMATALIRAGMKVTVFERERQILPGRTPPRFADFLETCMRKWGASVHTAALIDSVRKAGDTWEVSVQVRGHAPETTGFDLCLDCTGMSPDVALARDAGLRVCDRGILVDTSQRTSDPSILAAGDCAAVAHTSGESRSAGLWHHASVQGKVAGLVAVGVPAETPPSTGWHTFAVSCEGMAGTADSVPAMPRVACSFGDLVPREGDRVLESGEPGGDYRYAVVRGHRVSGYFQATEPSGLGGLIERLGETAAGLDLSVAGYPGPFSVITAPQALAPDPGTGKVMVKGRKE